MCARGWKLLMASLLLCFTVSSRGLSQNDPASALLAARRGAIVQLQVRGEINNQTKIEYGTGFLFQTSDGPRIITAGHVVGPDDKWDSIVDRCIYYRLAQNGSSLAYDCVLDAKIEPNIDLAEVYLDPFNARLSTSLRQFLQKETNLR